MSDWDEHLAEFEQLRDRWREALAAERAGDPEAEDRVRAAEGELKAHSFGAFRFPEFRAEWERLGLPAAGT